MIAPDVEWSVQSFDELAVRDLYRLLAARVDVFVVEQDCPYQDLDGHDDGAIHVSGWRNDGEPAAYARVLGPGVRFEEPSIGRVLTTSAVRGTGAGRELMRRSIAATRAAFPGRAIRISAQRYLERFYGELGFTIESEPYLEDGIPHVEMLLARSAAAGTKPA